MRRNTKKIVAAFFITLCCALPTIAQEKYGTVYFYRDRDTDTNLPQELGVLNPEAVLYLQGQQFLSLGERTFIGFKMPVGRYRLSTTINGKYTYQTLEFSSGGIYYVHITQVMYPVPYQTITQDAFSSAFESIRKCDALKEKKVKIRFFEMIRVNPTKRSSFQLRTDTGSQPVTSGFYAAQLLTLDPFGSYKILTCTLGMNHEKVDLL